MALTVLQIAYPLAPVGPDAVGGAEQVLHRIDLGLARAGHRSVVIACAGSQTADTLLPLPPPPAAIDEVARQKAQAACRRRIAEALARWPVDLVHCHGLDFDHYLPPPGPPLLATLHLPPNWYAPAVFRLERPQSYLHCVSTTQQRACPPGAPLLPSIPNGVPVPATPPRHAKRRFALAIGRICPEKGFHLALDAARAAGVPLLLAGAAFGYPAHQRYFRAEIVPRLDGERRFLGPVGMARKRRLLAAARCLLVPSLAPETSSLVAMEALACGTPVVAFHAGALPEIVEHGRTGFLVRDAREMAAAIRAADSLSSEDCRDAARRRFSAEAMVARYLTLYAALARGDGCPVEALASPKPPLTVMPGPAERPSPGYPRDRAARTEDVDARDEPAHDERDESRGGAIAIACVQPDDLAAPLDIAATCCTSLAELELLAPQWWALWRRAPAATPFQSPAWLVAWWRHLGGGDLRVVLLHRGGALVGVAPFFVHVDQGVRRLVPVGIGASDLFDALIDPAEEERAAPLLMAAILGAADDCDTIEFHELPGASPLLRAPAPEGWRDGVGEQSVCPVLRLPPSVEGLRDCVSGKTLYHLRQARRRCAAAGAVTIERADGESWAPLFDALVERHAARWRGRGEPGVLADPKVRRFHRAALPDLARAGLLRLDALRIDGRIVAAFYGLAGHGRCHAYLTGFDPGFAHHGAGTALLGHAIEAAIGEGLAEFDMLRGREAYKYKWGGADRPNWRRVLRRG